MSARILILAWLTLLPALLRGREISKFQLGGGAVVVLTKEIRGEQEFYTLLVRKAGAPDVKAWDAYRPIQGSQNLVAPDWLHIVSAALADNQLGVWLSSWHSYFELVMADLQTGASRLHSIAAPDYSDLRTVGDGQRIIRLTAPGRFEAIDYMDRTGIKPIVMECDWDGRVMIDGVPYKFTGFNLTPSRRLKAADEEEQRRKRAAEAPLKPPTKAPEEEARARPR